MSPTIVITGSTSGFGRALALELAGHGAHLVVAGRNETAAREVARTIGENQALGMRYDARDETSVAALWDAAINRFGRVDHWILNAGVGTSRGRLDELSVEEIRTAVDTNLVGALLGARHALTGMLAQGRGRIWITEGLGSEGRTLAGTGVYSATKAAVTQAFEVLALECKGTPLEVGFIRPGIMPTGLTQSGDSDSTGFAALQLRLLADSPEDVAREFAPRILAARGARTRLTWLTPTRIAAHLLTRPLGSPSQPPSR
ncbi:MULTISPECIES: SDR family oxidoreductase [Brevibacterium]|uniref:NADP-dependent 3-hydroxy acid dehydrogenase YdfG n=1 Tax=Brevibacterium aurantiacum TaxID=273384 RepID=A0A2H1IET3_BREAU|nr:SDR family oxidoreductase [Brevibacterium aurantiacum]SMX73650.1 NADP-dependent 3-hydroxy acid dehydrogenase YdfG [Brevibacterium aurantiacum]